MKDGVRILNFSRAELADFDALTAALESGKVASYVTDFPNEKVLQMKNTIAIPHLAASTPESEDNCAVMAADEISDYILNGNIRNSVNLPAVASDRTNGTRICVIHKNMPKMLTQITDAISNNNYNIETMNSKSKGDYAYVILDLTEKVYCGDIVKKIESIDGIIKARAID